MPTFSRCLTGSHTLYLIVPYLSLHLHRIVHISFSNLYLSIALTTISVRAVCPFVYLLPHVIQSIYISCSPYLLRSRLYIAPCASVHLSILHLYIYIFIYIYKRQAGGWINSYWSRKEFNTLIKVKKHQVSPDTKRILMYLARCPATVVDALAAHYMKYRFVVVQIVRGAHRCRNLT